MPCQFRTSGPKIRLHIFPSSPSPATVSSNDRCNTAARPPSSGWASGTSGWTHSRPYRSSGSPFSTGDPAPNACTAAPTSCTKPGSVYSAERQPPPTWSAASSTVTDRPALANVTAAARPLGPDPTTTASTIRRSWHASGDQPQALEPCPIMVRSDRLHDRGGDKTPAGNKSDDMALTEACESQSPPATASPHQLDRHARSPSLSFSPPPLCRLSARPANSTGETCS